METRYNKHLTYEIGLFFLISKSTSWFTLMAELNLFPQYGNFFVTLDSGSVIDSRDCSCTEYFVFPIYFRNYSNKLLFPLLVTHGVYLLTYSMVQSHS